MFVAYQYKTSLLKLQSQAIHKNICQSILAISKTLNLSRAASLKTKRKAKAETGYAMMGP